MTAKYPRRPPRSVAQATGLMLTSLRRWPGVPSFTDNLANSACGVASSGGGEGVAMPSNCAPAWGAWPPELDVEFELGDDEATGCGSRHGTRRAVSAPEPGLTHAVYGCILHHLPSLVVALLKLLLAAGGVLPAR